MRRVAIVQARMGSSRLPGKVAAPIEGQSMLARVVRRTLRAQSVDATIIATSNRREDDRVVQAAEDLGVDVFRGDENDVLARFVGAARAALADVVVRITSDCPLIDPTVIDDVVGAFERTPAVDFCSNTLRRTFPRGLDVEVVSSEALLRANREAQLAYERSHVLPYIYGHPELFSLRNLESGDCLGDLRWTVDTEADLAFARAVFERLGTDFFGWREVLALVRADPDIGALNANVLQKHLADG